MRVLVSGSAGMLARDLVPCLSERGHEVVAPPEDELDVTDIDKVMSAANSSKPDLRLYSLALEVCPYAIQNVRRQLFWMRSSEADSGQFYTRDGGVLVSGNCPTMYGRLSMCPLGGCFHEWQQ